MPVLCIVPGKHRMTEYSDPVNLDPQKIVVFEGGFDHTRHCLQKWFLLDGVLRFIENRSMKIKELRIFLMRLNRFVRENSRTHGKLHRWTNITCAI